MTVIVASNSRLKRPTRSQDRLEAIFHTVDTIKSDLNKCGMRLQEARQFCGISPFTSASNTFTCTYGIADEQLLEKALQGQQAVKVVTNDFFKKGKTVLIYDPTQKAWELNEIEYRLDGALALKNTLQHDYSPGSTVIALNNVTYSYYALRHAITRKVDNGQCQPLLEGVSDFYVTYFPDANSVLYRIEINKKEQIRGYIFLLNLV
ncbi:MAG: hypothetical protein ABII93_07785 [Chrysiogenia bacterium]